MDLALVSIHKPQMRLTPSPPEPDEGISMNLRKFALWPSPSLPVAVHRVPNSQGTAPPAPDMQSGNVVQLPRPNATDDDPLDHPVSLNAPDAGVREPRPAPTAGLMQSDELKAFFNLPHLECGKQAGARMKSLESLQQGKVGLISRFQHAVQQLAARKQMASDRLQDTRLQTLGISSTVTAQIDLRLAALERDIAALQEQHEQAAQGLGWVNTVLNSYQTGYEQGIRAALDAQLLGLE